MIDPDLPLELDDGTPVKLTWHSSSEISVQLPLDKSARRDGQGRVGENWYYYMSDGIWQGGDAKEYFVLRNSHRPELTQLENWD